MTKGGGGTRARRGLGARAARATTEEEEDIGRATKIGKAKRPRREGF